MELFWYYENKSLNPWNKKEKIDIKKKIFLIERKMTWYRSAYVTKKEGQKPR